MELKSLMTGVGYLKAGFLGFNKSGKTYTSVELALGVREHFKLPGPIGFFDTEASAQYVAPRVKRETGKDLIGHSSRALSDAIAFLRACPEAGVSVAVIDSVTHLWREVCDAYLKQRNEALALKKRPPRTRLSFEDWGPIKAKWSVFSDLYLNCPLHVIICGRAGYEYDYETDEDGKKELVKTGIKMKTEGEFGFEPSLLVEMERVQAGGSDGRITHRALVIGDRFGVLDGQSCDNPTRKFFAPYLAQLTAGTHAAVDTTTQTPMQVDEAGDAEWAREKRQREIFVEEISGLLTAHYPGQSAPEKKAKEDLLLRAFGTYSRTQIANTAATKIADGLAKLREIIPIYQQEQAAAAPKPDTAAPKTPAKPRLVKAGKGGDA